MKYKKIDTDNYELYFIKSNKFKTVLINTIIINEFNAQDITKEKVLSEYLINTNKYYSNEIEMSKRYMELYDPEVDIYDIFRDVHSKCFDISFLNEKYTEKGMNKKIIDFYFSLIFDINEKNNKLDEVNLNMSKQTLKTEEIIKRESSAETAYKNAMSKIRDDLPITKNNRIDLDLIDKINSEDLLKYYKDRLRKGKFLVFVIGDLEEDEIKELIDNNLNNKVYNNSISYKKDFNVTKSDEELVVKEKSSFNETIIYNIYKLLNLTEREKYIVLPIFNEIIGGSSSKLFNNVREKNSLAYYIYSNYSSNQSIYYIYAGIQKENYDKTIKLINKEINNMKNGNITIDEINSAKETILSNILKSLDSQRSILYNLESIILYERDDYNTLKDKFISVTKDEIINLSNKLNLDIIYSLEGDNNEKN